jgi:putative flippase GtrA
MSSPARIRAAAETEISAPTVEIVVPVRDEARVLAASVRRLHGYLSASFPFSFRITIADNGSSDGTWEIAQGLADELEGVESVRIDLPGRGRALSTVWSHSDAAVLAYMDVDLSTDLAALLPLVAPLYSGHSDLAIGSRLTRGARVVRGPKRELISRAYNALLHTILRTRFSDAQCGFKAVRADRARALLPLVRDSAWFFDTELLVLAERAGMRIHEVPVDWTDDPDSRVDILSTALADLRGVARLGRDLARGRIPLARELSAPRAPSFNAQVLRFAAVGAASTLAYALLYVALRPLMQAQAANALTLLLTAIANTAANRRFTFAVQGRARVVRHQAQGLVVFGLALALTSGSIAALHLLAPTAARAVELAVLTAANLIATVLRFVLLRVWVFRARRSAPLAAFEEPS